MVIDGEEEGCLQWLKEEYDITVFVFVCTWFTILFFFSSYYIFSFLAQQPYTQESLIYVS